MTVTWPTSPAPSAFWPAGAPGAAKPRDPYLRWAELSGWRNLMPSKKLPASLSFIVERSARSQGWGGVRAAAPGVDVPSAYDQALPGTGQPARFATLRLATFDAASPGVQLPLGVIEQRIAAIVGHADVERLQLGYPRGPACGEEPVLVHRPMEPVAQPQKAEVVLGVIDDGCPFAHADLLDSGKAPRIALLWQQSARDPVLPPWRAPDGFNHGRVLDRQAMVNLMNDSLRDGQVDEALCYEAAFAVPQQQPPAPAVAVRQWLKPSRVMLVRASHGSGVLALAGAPVAGLAARMPSGLPASEQPPYALYAPAGDAASRSPLIVVDLPREQTEISSGRWFPICGLDGLRFIVTQARSRFQAVSGQGEVPVVINMSSGAHAGAHAGLAMFERAMQELLAADDRLAFVLAAGNSRVNLSHGVLTVPKGGMQELGLFVPPSQPFDSALELWLPAGTRAQDVQITVLAPDGTALTVDGGVPEQVWSAGPGQTMAALMLHDDVVQAPGLTQALLMVWGTTSSITRLSPAPAGCWRVQVSNRSGQTIQVDAWVERDEVVYGQRRPQVARLFNPERSGPGEKPAEVAARKIRRENTLSNIATAALPLAAAAYTGRRADGPVSAYSALPALKVSITPGAASTPVAWLPLAAVADAGVSHPGVRVGGNRRAVLQRFNGTSAAAPQAARYLANEMASGKTRSAVVAALPPTPAPTPVPPEWLRHPAEPPLGTGNTAPHPADGRKRLP